MLLNYHSAMTTDPGAVPRDALPLLDDEEEVKYDPTSSKTGMLNMYVFIVMEAL